MKIEVRINNTVVRSSDPTATGDEATAFAKVLSENWLQGAPQDEPLEIEANREDGSTVIYIASIEPCN